MFTTNVGPLARTLRIVAGLAIVSLFFVYPASEWRYASLLGLVPLLTGSSALARFTVCSVCRPGRPDAGD